MSSDPEPHQNKIVLSLCCLALVVACAGCARVHVPQKSAHMSSVDVPVSKDGGEHSVVNRSVNSESTQNASNIHSSDPSIPGSSNQDSGLCELHLKTGILGVTVSLRPENATTLIYLGQTDYDGKLVLYRERGEEMRLVFSKLGFHPLQETINANGILDLHYFKMAPR